MTLPEIEAIEAAWRILDKHPTDAARNAAGAIITFLDELDDEGTINRLNAHRSGRNMLAGLLASFSRRRER